MELANLIEPWTGKPVSRNLKTLKRMLEYNLHAAGVRKLLEPGKGSRPRNNMYGNLQSSIQRRPSQICDLQAKEQKY